MVGPEDKTADDGDSVIVDLLDRLPEVVGVRAQVDLLVHGGENLPLQGLETDQKGPCAAFRRRLEQPVVLHDVEAGLSSPLLAGLLQPLEEPECAIDVKAARADDVVIDDEDPFLLDLVDFFHHIVQIAEPVLAAIEAGDRTEGAVVGAAAGGLDGLDEIVSLQEVPAGHRQVFDIRRGLCHVPVSP